MDYTKKEAKAYAKEKWRGHFSTLTLPLRPDLKVDEKGLRRNCRAIVSLGTEGCGCCWGMQEYWSLTTDERRRIAEIVVEEFHGKVLAGVHVTTTSVFETLDLAKHAEEIGADWICAVPPALPIGKTESMIYQWYKYIAENVNIGLAIFNQPLLCGINMSPDFINKLAVDFENVIAVKEAHGNIEQAIRTHQIADDKIVVSMPRDEIFFHLPYYGLRQQVLFADTSDWMFDLPDKKRYRPWLNLALKGEMDKAREVWYRDIRPVREVESKWVSHIRAKFVPALLPTFTTQVFKYWGECRGLAGGNPRPPLLPLTSEEKKEMAADIAALGLGKFP